MNDKLKGNICYFQSGGPTTVINSSFKGLFDYYKSLKSDKKFYYSHYGIQGLIDGELIDISEKDFPLLNYTPGSFTGSLRRKLKENDPAYDAIVKTIKKYDIRYLFPNGGNDSMDTCYKLSLLMKREGYDCKVIGIPKTVDNDLPVTDHTPGYASAAKYIANTTIAILLDDLSYQKGRINILECMGRDSGYLTASAALARLRGLTVDYIYVPEVAFDLEKEKAKWKACYDKKGHCLVVVSEGIRDKDGVLISASQTKDAFGNIQMGGVSSYLASLLASEGYKTRGIELSLPQRAASYLLSKRDIDEAMMVGEKALEKALEGKDGVMVCINRLKGTDYQIEYTDCPLELVGGKAVSLKDEYITAEKDNITDSFIAYLLPLIQGEVDAIREDGLLNV